METFPIARPVAYFPEPAADDGEDRITALSDDLRRRVVSRLPVQDAVRTTALSSLWRRVWHSTPLVLYDAHLHPDDEPARVAAVDRVLAAHPGPFHTVHLGSCHLRGHRREIARWWPILADRHMRDLALVDLPPGQLEELLTADMVLRLPADILRCAELEHLYLGFCVFPDTAYLPDGAGAFPHLRELAMISSGIQGRDLDHMLASSPVLETLALVDIGGPKRVRLCGQKLQCVLLGVSTAAKIAVVDAPRLERLIMWETIPPSHGGMPRMRVKITRDAPELRVLGYLEPRVHKLRIGNTLIKADTKVSPRSIVPSVKILGLRVNFGVLKEVQMLASFLRCFPNIETLHVVSALADEPTVEHYAEFFRELSPIQCVRSHIKMVVLHEFHGDPSELVFLNYLSERANELQKLILVYSEPAKLLAPMGQIEYFLQSLAVQSWASETCMVLLMGCDPEVDLLDFHRASNLSIDDPFLQDGLCFLSLIRGENIEQATTTIMLMNTHH
ncbi:hypothetical protein ACP70R_037259 [Stipagrostis hirtigluma subsp. patula]